MTASRSNSVKRRHLAATLFRYLCIAVTSLAIITLGVLIYQVSATGLPWLDSGFRNSFPSRFPAQAGIKSALYGTIWLVGQAVINIGAVVGLLPVTGLPLPFISAGGSALVVAMAVVGMLASFARAEPGAARALHARPPRRWVRILWAPLPPKPGSRTRPSSQPTSTTRARSDRRGRSDRRSTSGRAATPADRGSGGRGTHHMTLAERSGGRR